MRTKEERAAYDKVYREANKEKKLARDKVYRKAHREEKSAYDKAYHEANREHKLAKQKLYYEDNIEKMRDKNLTTNAERMTVNGKYVSRKHPLWKIGNYKSFNDAAFSSFINYAKSTFGDVYLIINTAWPEWIKVGKAIDASDRLKSYQTGDPFRSYQLHHSVTMNNRHAGEVKAHKALEALSEDRRNEWFKVDLTTAVRCIEAINE